MIPVEESRGEYANNRDLCKLWCVDSRKENSVYLRCIVKYGKYEEWLLPLFKTCIEVF